MPLPIGQVRNGGQELTIQSVQAALLCQEMIIVGDGKPTSHTGATLWNPGNDDITGDKFPKTSVLRVVVGRNFGQSRLGGAKVWRAVGRLNPAAPVVVWA